MLNKAIYDLHQSGRQWFCEMDNVLSKLNFYKLNWYNCVYMFQTRLITLLYDDIVLFDKTKYNLDFRIGFCCNLNNQKAQSLKRLEIVFSFTRFLILRKFEMFSKLFPVTSLPIRKGLIIYVPYMAYMFNGQL